MNSTVTIDYVSHYAITFSHNYNTITNVRYKIPSNLKLQSQINYCHFTSHCKWLPSAAFYDYRPEHINKQIIQNDDNNCNYHRYKCYCFERKTINCSIDTLGPVYPGQTLHTKLCNLYSNNVSTVLYAEVHNINLPNSTCKIAHQSQLINIIGNHSNTINYTIISSAPDLDNCELFLTATPF